MKTSQLIDDLIERTKNNQSQIKHLVNLTDHQLNWKEASDKWSILECIEHLNLYGDYYLAEIEDRMNKNLNSTAVDYFKSGLLGNYFAKSMLPKEKLNKMNTFKSMNPLGSKLDKSVLHRFLEQQDKMLSLLKLAQNVNLNLIRTKISISKLITLKLGDTFRVVIYHTDRHVLQALKVKAKLME